MGTLLVYRGDTLVNRMPLGDHDLRIGRLAENDIVLPDDGKAVSRYHAELRRERGGWVIHDLNSQNGTWVSASRVSRAELEPGEEIAIGPYRLMYEPEDVVEPELAPGETYIAPIAAIPDVDDADPMSSANMPTSLPVGAPQRGSGAGIAVATQHDLPSTVPGQRVPFGAGHWLATHRTAVMYGAAGLTTLVVAIAVVVTVGTTSAPEPAPPAPAATTTVAPAPDHYQAASTLVERGDYQSALADHLEPLLAINPDHQPAAELWNRVQIALAPPPPPLPLPPPTPAVKAPPPIVEAENIAAIKGESQAAYNNRVEAARSQYAFAERMLTQRQWTAALHTFERLLAEHARFRDVGEKARFARERLDEEQRAALAQGRKLEEGGDLAGAVKHYVRARELGADVSADIDRTNGRARSRADGLMTRAKVAENFNRADAIRIYREIVDLLPSGDPNRTYAEERLRQLAP